MLQMKRFNYKITHWHFAFNWLQ